MIHRSWHHKATHSPWTGKRWELMTKVTITQLLKILSISRCSKISSQWPLPITCTSKYKARLTKNGRAAMKSIRWRKTTWTEEDHQSRIRNQIGANALEALPIYWSLKTNRKVKIKFQVGTYGAVRQALNTLEWSLQRSRSKGMHSKEWENGKISKSPPQQIILST